MDTLSLEQAILIFVDVIVNDRVHEDYAHVCRKARLYKQLITGTDIEDLLIQFNPREDSILFEQRKRLTQVITGAICSSLMKPFYKVPRTDRVVKKVIPEGENQDAADEVLDKMDSFYGADDQTSGLDYYLQNRFLELTFSDPNAFIATSFAPFDPVNEKSTPYPFEIDSVSARYFEYDNNKLKLLIYREGCTYQAPMTDDMLALLIKDKTPKPYPTHYTAQGFLWTMQTDMFSIVMQEVGSDHFVPGEDHEDYNEDITMMSLENGLHYQVTSFAHLGEKVPAKRVGYKRDLLTDGRTFVNPLDDALCYLIDSIQTVSEFSLTKAQHVFPQKFQYAPACVGESDTNTCFNGRAAAGGICKICNGSGVMPVHTSAQDVVVLKIPNDTSKMMDLNKVMAYFSPPMDLVRFQNELTKQVKVDCHQTVFNSTVLLKDTTGQAATAETATSKNFDMDSINDTLAPFADNYAAFWLFEADMIARYTDNFGKVSFVFRFPSDFKMKSISDLYTEMQIANESNAPLFLIELLNDDIASTKFQDDPDQLLIYNVKKRLDPFRGMTDQQVMTTLTLDYTPLWKKVLSTNFEDVLAQAVAINDEFYLMDYENQMKLVRGIVDQMITEINSTKVTPTLKPIAAPVE